MRFNLKSIVAAVAMSVASASAMASIQSGTVGNAGGGGELFFVAYDATAGIKSSYIKDLGVTFSSFLTTPTYSALGSLNVSSDTKWGTYLSNIGGVANLGNTRWAVVSTLQDSTIGINNAQGSKLLVTGQAAAPAASNGQIAAAAGEINTVFLPDLGDASGVAVNNSYVFSASDVTPKNWSNIEQANVNSNLGFSIVNPIGTAANFYQLVRSSNRATTAGTVSTVLSNASTGYQWQFDGSSVYAAAAPVPEPETYGMLLAGLALVGAIARRRRAA
jgi:hypothetical protein